jgi:iron complex outermembrane receptor protein
MNEFVRPYLMTLWLFTILFGATGSMAVVRAQDVVANSRSVEEIVVTTRKREENLQDVPISIGVFSAEDIARMGIRDLADITKLSPSLQFDKSFSQNSVRVTIRGLSNTRGRSNVAFLVDGIDVSSETTGTNAGSPLLVNQRLLTDVERIEVVKGPQSALYGRAAFAGAINYVTKNPSDQFEASLAADVAEHGREEIYGSVSVPISDTLGVLLSGVSWNDDGRYKNAVSGDEFGGGDGYGVAGTLLWEPADNFSLKTRLTYTDDDYAPGAIAGLNDRRIPVAVPDDAADVTDETSVNLIPFIGDARGLEVRASEDPITGGDYPGNTLEVFRASMIAEWDVGEYTLSSYTGYTDADMTQRYDLDRQAEGRPDTILGHGEVDSYGNTTQVSQELRAASNWENLPVQMTLGLQYWQEDRDDHSRNISVTCRNQNFCGPDQTATKYLSWQDLYVDALANSENYRNPISADTESWSFYAMAEWDISETVTFTIEDRFVREDFDAEIAIGASCVNAFPINADLLAYNPFNDTNQPTCIPGNMASGSTTSEYQTPKFTLEWRPADNAMLYALAAKGIKPAGISLLQVPIKFEIPLDAYVYDQEKMWSYEAGAKTNWAGQFGELLVNGSAFYQDYTDKQTNTQQQVGDFLVGVVTNASAAWVKGLELETSWATPLQGLSFGAGYTWLKSEYNDFEDATRSAARITIAGSCGEVVEIRGTNHCLLDLSGNQLEFMPKHSLVLTGRYENRLFNTGMDWYVESNASYQGERYTSADNYTELDSFWLADARFGVTDESWSVIAYLNNVFDEDTISSSGGNPDVAQGYVDATGVAPPTLPTGFLPPPRTAGLRVQYQYR